MNKSFNSKPTNIQKSNYKTVNTISDGTKINTGTKGHRLESVLMKTCVYPHMYVSMHLAYRLLSISQDLCMCQS